uniref:4Fe-4S ferredoxin n=1 Tax=Archaeoglobus fulgidus TaxID=2234 RepID=A0A7C3RI38_ARCFL
MGRKAIVDRRKCAYCGACVAVCPADANELIETFLEIYDERCTGCGICVKMCPMGALAMVEVD